MLQTLDNILISFARYDRRIFNVENIMEQLQYIAVIFKDISVTENLIANKGVVLPGQA